VVMPCLPINTKRSYPLSGVTHCTAYELTLAARLGATLQIESGFLIPQDLKQGEPVFKRFVRFELNARGMLRAPCITVFISSSSTRSMVSSPAPRNLIDRGGDPRSI
jgi:hypothetical protein